MKETNQVAEEANRAVEGLAASMGEISDASESTSKIIKTIDEIAFQTNLLALNAAVEAARAGEARAGFAVVADEVRSLALRAADAARSTADLIQGSVDKIQGGSRQVEATREAFSKVSERAYKVGELLAEIASASEEQADGIEQLNRAVAEMDKVVQQNAANAEENAGASEEMNAQSEQMMRFAKALAAMAGEAANGSLLRGEEPARQDSRESFPVSGPNRAHSRGRGNNGVNGKGSAPAASEHEVGPERLIPLGGDDRDFRDFRDF